MRLVVVTGKGGVGKSTVAGALALRAAGDGAHAIVVEVAGRCDVARTITGRRPDDPARERPIGPGVDHVAVDAAHALTDYLRRRLTRPAAALLRGSEAFGVLAAATPGLAELLTIGKAWDLAQDGRHDVVVLDAPATGNALALLRAPRTFAATVRTGPIAAQARDIDRFLADPRRTAVVVVTTPAEMAVAEAVVLHDELRERPGLPVQRVVVNAVLPDRFGDAEVAALGRLRPGPARRAALAAAARARRQRTELRRLRAALPAVALELLPFAFVPELERPALERLAGELAGVLDQATPAPTA